VETLVIIVAGMSLNADVCHCVTVFVIAESLSGFLSYGQRLNNLMFKFLSIYSAKALEYTLFFSNSLSLYRVSSRV